MRWYKTFSQIVSVVSICFLLANCSSLNSGADLAQLPDNYQNIALLLPLNGPYENQGQAVRNGFLAAYYAGLKQGEPQAVIKIYDSSQAKNISHLYAKALANGADIVIGPLSKQNVKALAQHANIEVPTLSLNYLTTQNPPKKLFEFGISPINEAKQVADKASQEKLSNAIIIAPKATWGQNIADAFTKEFQLNGGKVVDSLYYLPKQTLRYQIRDLLKVNQSIARSKQVEAILGENVTYAPQRRKDFDMIFLVAPPSSGRQIIPLLRFYYANQIPIYSISMIYRGTENRSDYRDMDGVVFPDIPWIINYKTNANTQNSSTLMKSHTVRKYPRLYALGLDAFKLTKQIKELSTNPNNGLNAHTGSLYLGPKHQILQNLIWVTFKNGEALPI